MTKEHAETPWTDRLLEIPEEYFHSPNPMSFEKAVPRQEPINKQKIYEILYELDMEGVSEKSSYYQWLLAHLKEPV